MKAGVGSITTTFNIRFTETLWIPVRSVVRAETLLNANSYPVDYWQVVPIIK